MKISEKLADRLCKVLSVSIVENPTRTHASASWRNAGAWVWNAKVKDAEGNIFTVGSIDSMTECVRAKELTYHRHISYLRDLAINAEA